MGFCELHGPETCGADHSCCFSRNWTLSRSSNGCSISSEAVVGASDGKTPRVDLPASLLGLLVGSLPERKPWRSIVTARYLAGAVVGVTVLTSLLVV